MDVQQAALAFAALGQPTRLELLRLLLARGANGLPAGEAARQLGLAGSTLSFHLRALEQAGLVAATRQGRHRVYAVQLARLRALLVLLTDACCGGDPSRCGDLGLLPALLSGETHTMSPRRFNVLFLCTRNSARSIMAEAILGELAPARFAAFSAGSAPAGDGPLPEVLAQLKVLGHDVSALRSKAWSEFADGPEMDFVIALCDTLAGQACPDFGETVISAAWPLPDPAKFNGNAAERATLLNELYAGLRRRLEAFTSLPFASLDRIALQARLNDLADPRAMTRLA